MRIPFSRRFCAAAISALVLTSPAYADLSQEVKIVDGAYFPQKLYVDLEGQITFVNETHGVHRISGLDFVVISETHNNGNNDDDDDDDYSGQATSEEDGIIVVKNNRSITIQLLPTTGLVYQGDWPDGQADDVEELPTGIIDGELSYDEPPLEEDPEALDEEYES